MYYLKARYYDAQVHRMLNSDAFAGEIGNLHTRNVFAYSFNNPVNAVDDTGNWPRWMKKAYQDTKNWVQNIFRPEPARVPEPHGDFKAPQQSQSGIEYSRKKESKGSRKDKRKGSDERQKSGARERNQKHPNGEEHSRVPKGTGGIKRAATITLAVSALVLTGIAIVVLVADDATGIGVADDALIAPCVVIFTGAVGALA